METKLLSATVLCLLSIEGLRAQGASAPFDFAAAWREVEAEFATQCEQSGVVGASIAFVRGGQIAASAHRGFGDREGGRAVDAETIYHWASCTKTLTGIATMQLRDRGRLRLDQPIVELVPELREVHDLRGQLEAVTVRHLMQHAGGFRAGTWPWGGESWHPHEPQHWSQLVAMMPYTAIEFLPGSKFAYSNFGIVLLGRAIEQLSGDDYEVYMEKNVLRPLGMRSSYFDVTPYHQQRHRSHSYARSDSAAPRDLGPDFDTGITVSNGGLNAPIGDMARYVSFLLSAYPNGSDAAATLQRSSLEEMWVPTIPTGSRAGDEHIGLCFFVQQHGQQRVYTHTGGQRGFVSFFYVHPASKTGAVGAFNTDSAGPAMAAVRRACIERLSLRMIETPAAPPAEATWKAYSLRLQRELGKSHELVLTVPSGGHELHYERAKLDGKVVDVELRLVTPGMGEVVVAALEDLTVTLPAEDLGSAERVRFHISTWQRGAQYLVEPAHEPAASFELH